MSQGDIKEIETGVEATECQLLAGEIYDLIRSIQDPEKSETLEQLNVVCEKGVQVEPFQDDTFLIKIEFIPTVPHCSLATLIGLCVRTKLERSLPHKHKLDIFIQKGTHSTADEINKQINDKERTAAAMENPSLKEIVEKCIVDE